MSLDKNAVTKIARLSRIAVSDADKEHYAREISGILQWIEQLNEVNTENVPQLTSVTKSALPWREDKVTDGNQQEAILKNAPANEHGCFVVPKVIE
jgi:aspartyl-tRNA(Asn)/glutamyl-tRNA(Gln) amidotransferase subunit C